MSLNKWGTSLNKLYHSLAFRLTVRYAFIYTGSIIAVFLILYIFMSSFLEKKIDAQLSSDLVEFKRIYHSRGLDGIREEIILESESEGVKQVFFSLRDQNGNILISSNISYWGDLSIKPLLLKELNAKKSPLRETITIPGHSHQARFIYGLIAPGYILQLGYNLNKNSQMMKKFKNIFIITILILMPASAFVGWFMAKKALIDISRVTQTALKITNGNFDNRVKIQSKGTELQRLSDAFNNMLDKIQVLISEMQEMTDNIAHDLKSPITRIRGLAEITLTNKKSKPDYESMIANTIEECDNILVMIDTMLYISETEAGICRFDKKKIDLAKIINDACELFRPLSEDKNIQLITDIAEDQCNIEGSMQNIQRMVANLLDNAIKFTMPGGKITISVKKKKKNILISFSDTGIGIHAAALPNIFQRFYRCDESRTRTGSGLGLSLCQAIAKSHGGSIFVESTYGKGTLFSVTLPRS